MYFISERINTYLHSATYNSGLFSRMIVRMIPEKSVLEIFTKREYVYKIIFTPAIA
jgi:hypothetical protein